MVHNQEELYHAFCEADEASLELIIQEYIPGEDALGANYNAYYWEGRPLVEFTAHKIRNAPPMMGSPSVLISEWIPEVVELGRRILGLVGYSGYACTRVKRDPRDGAYKLMEVNARHNLSTSLAVRCGVNFPFIQYQHLVEGIEPRSQDYEYGIYWVDISRDIGFRLINFKTERMTLKEFITPYLSKHIFAVLDWRDPAPAFWKAVETLNGVISHGGSERAANSSR